MKLCICLTIKQLALTKRKDILQDCDRNAQKFCVNNSVAKTIEKMACVIKQSGSYLFFDGKKKY